MPAKPSRRPPPGSPKSASKPPYKSSSKPKPSFGKKAASSVKKYQSRTRQAAARLKMYGRGK